MLVALTPADAVAEGRNGRVADASDATGDNEIHTTAADGSDTALLSRARAQPGVSTTVISCC